MRMTLAIAAVALAPAAAAPDVSHLILQPTQVGKGYVMLEQAGGKLVNGQVTLNLCGIGYASERFRTTRLQVNYAKRTAPVAISNEVVTYRAGGAAQAMREVIRRVATCPHRPIDTGAVGAPKLTFRFTRISDPRLLKGYLAVRVDMSGTYQGKPVTQTTYAVYQQLGAVLSGTYSFGGTNAAQRALIVHAAEASAQNLRHGTSGAVSAPTA
jgi:hypothetical protein